MAQVTVRTYTRRNGRDLNSMLVQFANPVPFLENLAESLVQDLLAEIAPHNKTGVLAEGLKKVSVYQKRGRRGQIWAVGIGDPSILTDWNMDAPPGTIAAFLKWLREENKQFDRGQKRNVAKSRKEQVKRIGYKERLRSHKRTETQSAVERLRELAATLTRGEVEAEKHFEQFETLRNYLARRGKTYSFQKKLVIESIGETLRKSGVKQLQDEFSIRQQISALYIKSRHYESRKRGELEEYLIRTSLEQMLQEIYGRSSVKRIPGKQ